MASRLFRKLALLSTTGLMTATMAHAQDASTPAVQSTEETEATIVVTGSQIQGAQILATAAAIHFLPSLSFQLSCAYISNG